MGRDAAWLVDCSSKADSLSPKELTNAVNVSRLSAIRSVGGCDGGCLGGGGAPMAGPVWGWGSRCAAV